MLKEYECKRCRTALLGGFVSSSTVHGLALYNEVIHVELWRLGPVSDDEYWWDESREEIHFRESSSLFRVTRIAITDFFGLPDKRGDVTTYFVANRSWFRSKARELLGREPERDEFLITHDVLRKLSD